MRAEVYSPVFVGGSGGFVRDSKGYLPFISVQEMTYILELVRSFRTGVSPYNGLAIHMGF